MHHSANSSGSKKGEQVAIASDCRACHTKPEGGKPFTGGYGISSPMGMIYSTNITPSTVDGIGKYSEAEFARAVRDGIRADGSHLYPAMPYTSYTKLSDEDIHALYVYFMHAVPAIDEENIPTELPFPFNMRFAMLGWNMMFWIKAASNRIAVKVVNGIAVLIWLMGQSL